MESEDKVFSSDIERGQKPLNNNLYELLHFDPAQPKDPKCKQDNSDSCNFQPKTDKIYIPKKITKFLKVQTVRNLRKEFEEECLSYLPHDILAQENNLFTTIRNGSLRRDKTLRLAKSLLKGDNPLSRATWQMLTNINPDKHNHSTQFVLWNGTKIRVNGSKGGEKKFICYYDLGKKKIVASKNKNATYHTQKSLLRTLTVNFKPGPLSRKKHLDKSYQKFNVGETELVKLPKIGLEIQPRLGVAIDPTISDILASNRQNNDKISEKWASFAVSTLGTVKDSGVKQLDNESITFDMNYTHDQNQILMRRDLDILNVPSVNCERQTVNGGNNSKHTVNDDTITSEVSGIVEDMLNAVEISLTQDEIYTGIDEPREKSENEANLTGATRDKSKKKLLELQRLDVTVIRFSDSPAKEMSCTNPACTLGCFCASLENECNLKNHCGRFDCMFECKCDFTNYKVSSNIDDQNTEFIPGLLNLDSKINSKLAKEEKKFHQTVVLTQNDSILLKTKRRTLKTPKRYAEFINNIPKNTDGNEASIMVAKIDCKNVEPWCMVHNLYKCFCKGRFTDSLEVIGELKDNHIDLQEQKTERISPPKIENDENITKTRYGASRKSSISSSASNSDVVYEGTTYLSTCSRIKAFTSRKYSDGYYRNMNEKIIVMEANDKGLHKKLMAHVNKLNDENNQPERHETPKDWSDKNEKTENVEIKCLLPKDSSETTRGQSITALPNHSPETKKSMPNKAKLIAWLEANYKHYKQRIENGQKHIPLEAPKLGKIALYPWEVILERYKLRKNYFVVTQEPPYRIYIAVDLKNPFLTNCINIDRIPFEDLRKYPITIKNLLDDTADLKDNFYILCGLAHCWELIGSVTKLSDRIHSDQSDSDAGKSDTSSTKVERKAQEKDKCSYSFKNLDSDKVDDLMASTEKGDISKWFFMMIENDFSEIQFHTRGFFVKHENIMKAVNVARASGKTVRLSSQKFNQNNDSPQFGIYAIPHETNVCAFVGPYEEGDLLEIESVMKKSYSATEMPSRGVWMTTKKSDDLKLIDEPLLFLPQMRESDDIITLNKTKLPTKRQSSDISHSTKETADQSESPAKVSIQSSEEKIPSLVKLVKPLKIRRVYSLTPGSLKAGCLKPVSLLKPLDTKDDSAQPDLPSTSTCAIDEESFPIPIIKTTFSLSEVKNCNRRLLDQTKVKPIAEIAPQIKIHSKTPDLTNSTQEQSGLRGMLILKPEEINQRHSENKLFHDLAKDESDIGNDIDNNGDTSKRPSDMDIENFLATSEICAAPTIESIYVVSDEETNDDNTPKIQDVWIECQNIPNIGCLKGRKDSKNELSFEFPGFKFTDFYPEVEAFAKINQVLSRKIYIPKKINLEWKVIEREEDRTSKEMLNSEHLGPDYFLTVRGLFNKRDLKQFHETPFNKVLWNLGKAISPSTDTTPAPLKIVEQATEVIKDLEAESKNLEREHEKLRAEAALKRSQLLLMTVKVPKEVRSQVTKSLIELDK